MKFHKKKEKNAYEENFTDSIVGSGLDGFRTK